MCELLAINFDRSAHVDFTFRAFAMRDVENADGWGLAWYPDHSLAIAKEPLTWRKSRFAGFLQTYGHLNSNMYLAHMRRKTVGGESTHADTHPFRRELMGREYCFAHNGTVYGTDEIPLGQFLPIGATDSEHVFCHLMNSIAQRQSHLDTIEDWRWVHELFYTYNKRGKFNCQLTDGRRLICYHDHNAFKGMWMEKLTMHPHHAEHLDDPTMHVDVEADGINRGIVVASRPLSRNRWLRFKPTQMIVVEAGVILHKALIVDGQSMVIQTKRKTQSKPRRIR